MKRIFCPKCDNQLTFDDSRYPLGKILAFVCPQCGKQFKIKLGHKKSSSPTNDVQEIEVPDFTYGHITVLENGFGYKQELPLHLGENLIGRRNKDTTGVHVPIITSDPSMGRKHCVIFVKETGEKKYNYTLRDYSSITGTFLSNNILGKNEQVLIEEGAIITIGATTFILHTADDEEEITE